MEGCGSKNHKHSGTRKPIPDASPFRNLAELRIISNPSRDGRNVLQHLPQDSAYPPAVLVHAGQKSFGRTGEHEPAAGAHVAMILWALIQGN